MRGIWRNPGLPALRPVCPPPRLLRLPPGAPRSNNTVSRRPPRVEAGPSRRGEGDEPSLPPTLAARVRGVAAGVSWSEARDLCRSGRVLVDEQVVTDPSSRPRPGQAVTIAANAEPMDRPSLLVHFDADIAVVR